MVTRSPFLTPLAFSTLAMRQTSACSCAVGERVVRSAVVALPDDRVWSPRSARCRSRQLAETFSTPSANQRMRKSALSKETSFTWVKGLIQSSRPADVAPVAVGVGLDPLHRGLIGRGVHVGLLRPGLGNRENLAVGHGSPPDRISADGVGAEAPPRATRGAMRRLQRLTRGEAMFRPMLRIGSRVARARRRSASRRLRRRRAQGRGREREPAAGRGAERRPGGLRGRDRPRRRARGRAPPGDRAGRGPRRWTWRAAPRSSPWTA